MDIWSLAVVHWLAIVETRHEVQSASWSAIPYRLALALLLVALGVGLLDFAAAA